MMRYSPMSRDYDLTDFFGGMFPSMPSNTTLLRTDVREKDGRYYLDVDVPGFQKEEVKLELKNGDLTISADHQESKEEKDEKGNLLRQERYSGSVSRSFHVGTAIQESDIHAMYKDGTLTIDFPTEKTKEAETRKMITIL